MKKEYQLGDFNSFFEDALEVTEYILNKKFYGLYLDPDEKADIIQDCMVSLWEKHLSNKIDTEKGDLMAFVWRNSSFKILDYFKKKNRREKIIYFFSYEEVTSDNVYAKNHMDDMTDENY